MWDPHVEVADDDVEMCIPSAVVRGVDIMEGHSPARVVQVCRKYNLTPGDSLDLLTGWDLSKPQEQPRARDLIRATCPRRDFRHAQNAVFRKTLILQHRMKIGRRNLKYTLRRPKAM